MKKKLLIAITAVLLLIPGIFVYAADGTGLITSTVSQVEPGQAYAFQADLTQIPETYTSYTLSFAVTPEISYLTTAENVSFTYNAVQKTYEISSAALTGLTALTVSAYLPGDAVAGTTYTVTATALNDTGESVTGNLSFTVIAATEEAANGGNDTAGGATTETPSSATTGGTAVAGGSGTASASSSSTSDTTTYQGSYRNYLDSLAVTGYDFQTEFQKTNNTYFVTVPNDVTEVTVKASADHEEATVEVAGDDDLEVGVNKVLISVTAENGDVRTYRIYVTREDQA